MGISVSIIVVFLILIPIFAAVIVLQVFLSKATNKWLGLILPIISFVIASIIGIGRLIYDFQTTFPVIFSDIIAFILLNIPTLLYLGIYFICRRKFEKKKELEKMNIQDLE